MADAEGAERIVRADEVLMTMNGEEALLVDQRSGNVHVVNSTAARVWELCAEKPTIDELAEKLAASYGIAYADVREDVEAMVGTFRELGVVELGPAR